VLHNESLSSSDCPSEDVAETSSTSGGMLLDLAFVPAVEVEPAPAGTLAALPLEFRRPRTRLLMVPRILPMSGMAWSYAW
jgi:hypothetical protein